LVVHGETLKHRELGVIAMDAPREQEQSIKERKKLLFDDDPPPLSMDSGVERKPFAMYLRQTPAEPLSMGIKAMLLAAGIAVALLLAAAAWRSAQPKVKEKEKASPRVEVRESVDR
jgi:hypothetical protein